MGREHGRYLMAAGALLAGLLFAGCSASPETGEGGDQTAFFEVVQERAGYGGGAIDYTSVDALGAANDAAAFRFYRELRGAETNLIFSPYSLSRVFSAYFDGEREAAAFEALFGFTTDVSSRETWDQLGYLATDRSDEEAPPEDRSRFDASDIYWVDVDAQGGADWEFFDRVHKMELSAEPQKSRQLINGWVEEESEGLLVDFLPDGAINQDTFAVATNVVFFLGAWGLEFDDAGMVAFAGLSGAADLPAFSGTAEMFAERIDGVTIVQIPYAQGYSHWIVMPDEDFVTFANGLDAAQFDELKSATTTYEVTLTMPEFTAESRPDMVGAIDRLRAETGTSGGTLSGAHVETYFHQAAIEVTREGTRAAAASAVVEHHNNAPAPPEPLAITVDRPFVHVIEDTATGAILFLGEFGG